MIDLLKGAAVNWQSAKEEKPSLEIDNKMTIPYFLSTAKLFFLTLSRKERDLFVKTMKEHKVIEEFFLYTYGQLSWNFSKQAIAMEESRLDFEAFRE